MNLYIATYAVEFLYQSFKFRNFAVIAIECI